MRSRFRRGERVFTVELTVHQLDSIPALHRLLHVHWRARRATPSEGRTPSLPVSPINQIKWDTHIPFVVTIPADTTDPTILQPSPLTLQLRSERRSRWLASPTFLPEGTVQLDISDVAALGFISRNFLVQDSLLNTTLKLSLRVTHQSGDKIFRTRQLAARSSPTADDPVQDDDSAPVLPPHPSLSREASLRPNQSADHRLERFPSANTDRTPSAHSRPATPPRPTSSSAGLFPSVDPPVGRLSFEEQHRTSTVLQDSIPNPDIVQRRVYEDMFQATLRDKWPAHIIASRVDATASVDAVYKAVCTEDGIGVAAASPGDVGLEAVQRRVSEQPSADKTLSLELLIESSNGQQAAPGQLRVPKKTLGRSSPRLPVRSSSMGEISELAKLSR